MIRDDHRVALPPIPVSGTGATDRLRLCLDWHRCERVTTNRPCREQIRSTRFQHRHRVMHRSFHPFGANTHCGISVQSSNQVALDNVRDIPVKFVMRIWSNGLWYVPVRVGTCGSMYEIRSRPIRYSIRQVTHLPRMESGI
jgi:hypothetical protein